MVDLLHAANFAKCLQQKLDITHIYKMLGNICSNSCQHSAKELVFKVKLVSNFVDKLYNF